MRAAQALSQALAEYPDVNATLQSDMRAIVRHRHHNIGVAIATPTGLVVRPQALHPFLHPASSCCTAVTLSSLPHRRHGAGKPGLPRAKEPHAIGTSESAAGSCCRH